LVRFAQTLATESVKDRDWWRDANPSWVLWVIAWRTLALGLTLLIVAAAVTLYTSPSKYGAADLLIALVLLSSIYLLVMSARRVGDILALHIVRDADPGDRGPVWVRALLAFAVISAMTGLAWCGYCLAHQSFPDLTWADHPVAFTARTGALIIAFGYVTIACSRAFALLISNPPFYPLLIERIYGDSWLSFKRSYWYYG
jgi:hypothetical protein